MHCEYVNINEFVLYLLEPLNARFVCDIHFRAFAVILVHNHGTNDTCPIVDFPKRGMRAHHGRETN